MNAEDLESASQLLFPEQGKNALAAALGIDPSTLWRYAQRGRIPGPVSAAVASWLVLKRDFDLAPPAEPCSTRDIEELAEMADPGIRRRSGLLGIEAAASVVFGDAWKGKLASALGVDYSTIWRQITSENIQGPVIAALRAWTVLKRLGGSLPGNPADAPRSTRRQTSKYARLLLEDD
jgi:predicted DNA-binding transcriptional regulator AlpA